MKGKVIAVVCIIVALGLIAVTVLYSQNELNDHVSAAKQLQFSLTSGGVSSIFINYVRSEATIWFGFTFQAVNPSSKSLTIPSFNLTVYMDNNRLGDVSIAQTYLQSGYNNGKSYPLGLEVQSSQFSPTFNDTFFDLADQVWNEKKPSVTFKVIGTANINVAYSFLSATVPVSIDSSKTANLLKP